jgi:hypothetical protein
MLSLLERAHFYENLSPGERALLKIVEGLLISAVIAGVAAALPIVSTQNVNAINWSAVLAAFVAPALKTLYDGVAKYFKAFGDPPLERAPQEPSGDTGNTGNTGA